MHLGRTRRDGLSLVEVIVAMAIFLIALVGLTELLTAGGRLASDGQRRSQAARLCLSKLAEKQAGVPVEDQGEFEEAPGFSWSVDSQAGAADMLFTVTVTVTFLRRDGSTGSVSLCQMMLDPTAAGSVQDAYVPSDGTTTTDSSGTTSSGTTASSGTTTSSGAASSGAPSSGGATGQSKTGSSGNTGMTGAASSGGGKSGSGMGGKN